MESMCHDLWAVCLVNCVPKKRLCVLCVSVFGVTVLMSDACRGWLDNLLPTALSRKPGCFTPRGKDNRLRTVEREARAKTNTTKKRRKGRWSGTLGSLACDLFCTFMQMLICIDGISRGDINSAIC